MAANPGTLSPPLHLNSLESRWHWIVIDTPVAAHLQGRGSGGERPVDMFASGKGLLSTAGLLTLTMGSGA